MKLTIKLGEEGVKDNTGRTYWKAEARFAGGKRATVLVLAVLVEPSERDAVAELARRLRPPTVIDEPASVTRRHAFFSMRCSQHGTTGCPPDDGSQNRGSDGNG